MASRKLLVLMAGFVAAVATPATAAYAGTKCKDASVTGLGGSNSLAVSTWVNHVKRTYGADWSNYSLARNKRSTYQFLPPAEGIYSVTAMPCKRT
jgi:hypothetical protein